MDTPEPTEIRGVRRVVYITLAMLFLGLGLLGVLLPGLPTTPFLLLMSYFLVQSSPWLHDRVVRIPVVGKLLDDWRENRGVRRSVKVIACLMVLGAVALSLGSRQLTMPANATIVVLATVGLCVVWRLPTVATPPATATPEIDGEVS